MQHGAVKSGADSGHDIVGQVRFDFSGGEQGERFGQFGVRGQIGVACAGARQGGGQAFHLALQVRYFARQLIQGGRTHGLLDGSLRRQCVAAGLLRHHCEDHFVLAQMAGIGNRAAGVDQHCVGSQFLSGHLQRCFDRHSVVRFHFHADPFYLTVPSDRTFTPEGISLCEMKLRFGTDDSVIWRRK